VRHAEPLRQPVAVAVVPVQQLDHARGRAKLRDARQRLRVVHRVDDPDPPLVVGERVGPALHRLVDDPAEAQRVLEDARHPATVPTRASGSRIREPDVFA